MKEVAGTKWKEETFRANKIATRKTPGGKPSFAKGRRRRVDDHA
jgi:hypothetical protein